MTRRLVFNGTRVTSHEPRVTELTRDKTDIAMNNGCFKLRDKVLGGDEISLEEALELINLTLDNKNLKNGLKEIARLQELVADNYAGEKTYDVSLEDLYNCLLPFAVISK